MGISHIESARACMCVWVCVCVALVRVLRGWVGGWGDYLYACVGGCVCRCGADHSVLTESVSIIATMFPFLAHSTHLGIYCGGGGEGGGGGG